MPASMPVSPLSFAKDAYFPNDLSYHQLDGCASFFNSSEGNFSRPVDQQFRSMPSPACSRALSHDNLNYLGGTATDDVNAPGDPNHYFSTTAANGVTDVPAVYDAAGGQYPQAREYCGKTGSALPDTPLETPSFSRGPTQPFDMPYMAPTSNLKVADREDPPSLSPTVSQYRQSFQAGPGLLAAEFDAARRQSTDTGSTSTKSVRSGINPVSTVLAHHVYSVLSGEQAWNVIKKLQQVEIVRDVWSEVATMAHPDKAPEARESPLWDQIVSGKVPLNLQELDSEDLVLVFSGLALLAKRAARLRSEPGKDSGGLDRLKIFVDSHTDQ